MKKILILHNAVRGNDPDEADVLAQRDLVSDACRRLGYSVSALALGDDIAGDMRRIRETAPDLVFNLTEALFGKGELLYIAPALLNALKIPYTGVPAEALFMTTNKVLAKKFMRLNGIPTADFFSIDCREPLDAQKTYIAKPVWEEASVGISEDLIFHPEKGNKPERILQLPAQHYFIEEFIEGREFNISLLADRKGVEVLPPAEMIFGDYFNDKPKILGYKAKWVEDSPEYCGSSRAFGTLKSGSKLEQALTRVCRHCWEVFGLRAYARIDLRVDARGKIFVLEVNGNPCIAPDSGFVAALGQAGYSHEIMVKRIIEDAE